MRLCTLLTSTCVGGILLSLRRQTVRKRDSGRKGEREREESEKRDCGRKGERGGWMVVTAVTVKTTAHL